MIMKVKTADFKNHLSRYLRQVRTKGTIFVIMDREKPVAIVSPIAESGGKDWRKRREQLSRGAARRGLDLSLPKGPARPPDLEPTLAPDGRTDISTIDLIRRNAY
jgi:antitoxin (DNA-binding transcriptional repressor) of toxin-antitoxin stability system